MSENDDNNDTNTFLQGVLSQPGLKEKFTRGFASRNLTDKLLFDDIVHSTTAVNPVNKTNSHKKEGNSKVDRIIEDFLEKVKKRSGDSKIRSFSNNQNEPEFNTPLLDSPKRLKSDFIPRRYFKATTSTFKEDDRYDMLTANRSKLQGIKENGKCYYREELENDIRIPKLSFIMKRSEELNSDAPTYFNQRFLDLDKTSSSIFSSISHTQVETNKCSKNNYNNTACNTNKNEGIFGSCSTSPNSLAQEFKFECDFISPIEYNHSRIKYDTQKPTQCIYPPNAFSTPKYKHCNPHLMNLIKTNKSFSHKSVGTQTTCNHICLMCYPPINKSFMRHDLFYEE